MNLNSLKKQLKEWEKKNEKKSDVETRVEHCSAMPRSRTVFIERSVPRISEKVVGGDIIWKPVDKASAMLIRKAPWWALPVQEIKVEEVKQTSKPKQRNGKTMSASQKIANGKYCAAIDPCAIIETKNDMAVDLNVRMVKETEKATEQSERLVERTREAHQALEVLSNSYQREWIDFVKSGDEKLKELRLLRMAQETEVRRITSDLREVRNFFMDKNHEAQMQSLREFVDLCERLQKLKDSGFLDTVADTMLRLSSQ